MRRRNEGKAARAEIRRARERAGGSTREVVLRDLGRGPEEQAIFSLPSPLLPWGALLVGLLVAAAVQALVREGPVGALLSAALMLGFFVFVVFPRKLVVGADGLLLVWLLRARFVPYADIAYVETSDGFYFKNPGINIALRSGSAVDFATSIFKERWAERDALLLLIRASVDEAAQRKPPRAPDALLRAGREHLAWAHGLRGLGAGAQLDPRTPPVPAEDLLRVAESPVAPLALRSAAFVALAANADPDVTRRLRFAADHTAAPDVRAALEGALDAGDDEHAIARVLAYAESESKPGPG